MVLEQLRSAPRIDLVIADWGIRGMPVWDIVQEATWYRPGVPFIRLIEERTDALPAYGVDPSAEVLLQRPVTIIALLAAIEGLLSRPQRALTKVFHDPRKARAVKDALNTIEQGAG